MAEIPADQPSATDNCFHASQADVGDAPSSEFGAHVVMFWVLIALAVMVFTPCVLIPVWLETEDLARTEADVAARTARLKAHIARQERLIKALTSDPLVNERIAKRDLRFRRAGEQVQRVENRTPLTLPNLEADFAPGLQQQTPPRPEPPAPVRIAQRWLPSLPWVELFGRSPNRTIFMVMAGGMLVAAFILFGQTAPQGTEARHRGHKPG